MTKFARFQSILGAQSFQALRHESESLSGRQGAWRSGAADFGSIQTFPLMDVAGSRIDPREAVWLWRVRMGDAAPAASAPSRPPQEKRRAKGDDERIRGTDDKDRIRAGDGNDNVRAKAGNDKVWGGDGNDRIRGDDDKDRLWGGDGNDKVWAGDGNDKAWGGDDNDRVDGGRGNDRVYGDRGNDRLLGDGGNDRLYGDKGNDRLWGAKGADRAYGDKGNDRLWGGKGADRLHGDKGNDKAWGGAGRDQVFGGRGNDKAWGGGGPDKLRGAGGNDRLWGGKGDDKLFGDAGRDRLIGGDGDDALSGGGGRDRLVGGDGDDALVGGGGDDAAFGGDGADVVAGGSGDDRLDGGDGDDEVVGGSGDDVLRGDAGDDVLDPGPGLDAVFGGDGDDLLRLEGEKAEYAVATVDVDGEAGFELTRIATGDVTRVAGVERVSYAGGPEEGLGPSAPASAPVDADAMANVIRSDASEGDGTGLTALSDDPDATDAVTGYDIDDPRFTVGADGVVRVAAGASFDDIAEPRINVVVTAVSSDGSLAARSFAIDVVAPESALTVSLASDTGRSAIDRVTSDPSIKALVVGAGDATSLTVAIDGGPASQIADRLDPAGMAAFAPDGLADGAHEAVVSVTFEGGATATSTLSFTLDTAAPALTSLALAPSSDTGALGDGATGFETISLIGEAEARARVSLGDKQAIVGLDGAFSFGGVANPDGENAFQVTVRDLAGNATQDTLTIQGTTEQGLTPVLDWMQITLDAIASDATGDTTSSRTLAMVSTAMFDVVAAIDGTNPFLVAGDPPAGLSLAAAVATAARTVLSYAYPAFEDDFQATLDDYLADEDPAAAAAGIAFGELIAGRTVLLRDDDGWDDFETYDGSEEIGAWRPTAPLFNIAVDPHYATLDTWALSAPDQHRPGGPPALTSQAYAEALEEVQELGARDSGDRTADQTQAARFWKDGGGTYTTPGRWADIALGVAMAEGLSIAETAELMAKVNVSVADAMIAAWDAKYAFGLWRPSNAIEEADEDGNPATVSDPDWAPFLNDPSHPEYVSGHATASGAAAAALAAVFGDDTAFTTDTLGLPGVLRSYDRFSEAAAENAESRVWAGVHFSFSNDDGLALGDDVARTVLDAFERGEDTVAPKILFDLDAAAGLVVPGDTTVTGTALDGLSGLQSLTVAIDGAAPTPVATDAQGGFSVSLAGVEDGLRTLVFTAEDAEGNVAERSVQVTVDGLAPVIEITSLSDGGELAPGDRLAGSVDGTGSKVASLSYSVDGAPQTLAAGGESADFDRGLDLGALAAGEHVIEVTARDAAGNAATRSLTVTLTDVPDLRVVSLSPGEGDEDVGVTQRPQVEFSRPVDPATLTNDTFWAEDASGAKLPATVLLSQDGATAWMFFDDPMPGAESVTVRLDGAVIAAAADGALLDGDADGEAGGAYEATFTTVSQAAAPNTALSGFVVGPGPDLRPMTTDDFSVGADGIEHTDDDEFLVPIANAEVFILGFHDIERVFTDDEGRFELTSVPAGNVKVVVNGQTASNPPDGYYYPEMVMDVEIKAGQANTLMDSMGGIQQQLANEGRGEVYLPQVSEGILVDLLEDGETEVTVDAEGAPNLTEAQRGAIRLTVQPGVAVDEDGQPLTDGAIGISTVPPELVRDMLPEGVMQHTFDLTIQAPGAGAFTTPAELTLPNVFGAAPGTKLNILSFDHTTGRLVIEGTATVSEDGETVTTDPGTGITKPGWHGLTPPGGNGCNGGDPLGPDESDPDAEMIELAPETEPLYFDDEAGGILWKREWRAPDALPETPPEPGADEDCPEAAEDLEDRKQPWLQVTVTVDGPLADFMEKEGNLSLVSQSFVLRAGTGAERSLAFSARSFVEMFGAGGLKNVEKDILFASKITVEEREQDADGNQTVTKQDVYITRYVDAVDDDHTDGQLEFVDVVNDGALGNFPVREFEVRAGAERPVIGEPSTGNFVTFADEVWFDPEQDGDLADSFQIRSPLDEAVAGTLQLKGHGAKAQNVTVDKASIKSALAQIATGTDADTRYTKMEADGTTTTLVTAAEINAIDTGAERETVAQAVVTQTNAAFGFVAPGISTGGTGGITIKFSTDSSQIFGTSSPAGGLDGFGTVETLIAERNKYSVAERTFRHDDLMNDNFTGTVEVYPNTWHEFRNMTSGATLAQLMANTAIHEYAHTLTSPHSFKTFSAGASPVEVSIGGVLGKTDYMNGHAGDTGYPNLSFTRISSGSVKIAANVDYTKAEAADAFNYHMQNSLSARGHYATPFEKHGATPVGGPSFEPETGDNPLTGPVLAINRVDIGDAVFAELDLGMALADGAGGASNAVELFFANYGDEAVVFDDVSLDNSAFRLSGLAPGDEIAPGEGRVVEVIFDPTAIGPLEGALTLATNDLGLDDTIALSGFAQADGPALSVALPMGNNLGGQEIGENVALTAPVVVTNHGDETLEISGIMVDNVDAFSLLGLPGDIATSPIGLEFGETFTFEVAYDAASTGLERALIDFSSNDESGLFEQVAALGTGFDELPFFDWGNDYFAVKVNDSYIRTVTDADGGIEIFLPAETDYEASFFDPVSGLIAKQSGTTPASGSGTDLTSGLVFLPSTAMDTDFDGLADDIEKTIGTSIFRRDSNADGVDDFTAVQLGLNPLEGFDDPVGPIGALQLTGSVERIMPLEGVPGQDGAVAVVRTASALALLDMSDGRAPTMIREIPLDPAPAGIAYDAVFDALAVTRADGTAGFFDLSDLIDQGAAAAFTPFPITGAAGPVIARNGVAYVATDAGVEAYDLATGGFLSSIALDGASQMRGMAGEGDHLYVLPNSGELFVVELGFAGAMSERGSVATGLGGREREMFAGDGVVYIPADNGFLGGYATFDVSDPAAPASISGADVTNVGGEAIALNGSGLGLLVGSPGGVGVMPQINLMNTSDPEETGRQVTAFTTETDPGVPDVAPTTVAIAAGLGYVGLADGRILMVNYLARDVDGMPPQVALSGLPEDFDPDAPGRQLIEGSSIAFKAAITDDVQLRNVQMLVNGEVVYDDATFPFDFSLRLPTLDDLGGDQVNVQVRTYDTGGNVGRSDVIEIELVADTFPPELVDISVEEGQTVGRSTRTFRLRFSEPVQEDMLDADAVSIIGPGGPVAPERFILNPLTGEVIIVVPQLGFGAHRIEIDESRVIDAAGNAMGEGATAVGFEVAAFSIEWSASEGGDWDEPGNWSLGRLPDAEDDVLIDAAGDVVVDLDAFNVETTVATLVARDELKVSGYSRLVVSGEAAIDRLVVEGGSEVILMSGATIGELVVRNGRVTTHGELIVTDRLDFHEGHLQGEGSVRTAEDAVVILGEDPADGDDNGYQQWLYLATDLEIGGDATLHGARLQFRTSYYDWIDEAQTDRAGSLIVPEGVTLDMIGDEADMFHIAAQSHRPYHAPDDWNAMPGGLVNHGVVRKTGGGESYLDGELNGDGAFVVEDGDFVIRGRLPVSVAGAFPAVKLEGGALIVDEDASIAHLEMIGGGVFGDFDLTITDTLRVDDGGGFAGPGKVTLSDTATGLIGERESELGYQNYFNVDTNYLYTTLEVDGSLDVETTHLYFNHRYYDSDAAAYVERDGVLDVGPDGVLNLIGGHVDLRSSFNIEGDEDLVISGVVNKVGPGTVELGIEIGGEGVINVLDGTIELIDGVIDVSTLVGVGSLKISGGTLLVRDGESFSLPSLEMTGGYLQLEGTGALTVTERFDWTNGFLRGDGKVVVAEGAFADIGGDVYEDSEYWNTRSVYLDATLEIAGEASLEHVDLYAGGNRWNPHTQTYSEFAGTLRVLPTGVLTSTGHDVDLYGSSSVDSVIDNAGEVRIEDGVLRNRIDVEGDGAWVEANGVLHVAGGRFSLKAAHGLEAVVVSGGVLVVDEAVSLARLTQTGGAVEGDGALTVTEAMTWTGGAQQGAGRVIVADGASAALGNAYDADGNPGQPSLNLYRELEVLGDVVHQAARLNMGRHGDPDAPGTVSVGATGVWTFVGHLSDVTGASVANVFDNVGAIAKTGGGESVARADRVAYSGDGSVTASDGSLEIGGATYGSYVAPDAIPTPGDPLASGETLTLTAGETLDALTITGGALHLEGDATIESLTLLGGVIEGPGLLTIGGVLHWRGGTMRGEGDVLLEADATARFGEEWDENGSYAYHSVYLQREFTALGDVDLEQARMWMGGSYWNGSETVQSPGVLAIDAGASLDLITPVSEIYLGGANDGATRIVNDGVVRKPGGGVSEIRVPIEGGGRFEQPAGPIELVHGATLSLDGSQVVDRLLLDGGVLMIEGDVEIGVLDLRNGEVLGDGSLDISDSLIWRNGTLRNAGGVDILAGADAQIGSGRPPEQSGSTTYGRVETTLEINGMATLRDGALGLGARRWDPDAGEYVYHAGAIVVHDGGEMVFSGPSADINGYGLSGGGIDRSGNGLDVEMSRIINDGVMRKVGVGDAQLEGVIGGTGAFVTEGGRFAVGYDGELTLDGMLDIDRVVSSGGIINAAVDVELPSLEITGGSLVGDGAVTVTETLVIDGSARLFGAGALVVADTATGLIGRIRDYEDSISTEYVGLSRDLVIDGLVRFEQVDVDVDRGGYDYEAEQNVRFDADIEIGADGTMLVYGPYVSFDNDNQNDDAQLINGGLLQKDGLGAMRLGLDYVGDGAIEVLQGDIAWSYGSNVDLGRIEGLLDRILIDGGVVTVDRDASVPRLEIRNGDLVGPGDLTVTEAFDLVGGRVIGDGALVVADTATASIGGDRPGYGYTTYPTLARPTTLEGDATVELANLYLGAFYYDPQDDSFRDYDGDLILAEGSTSTFVGEHSDIYEARGDATIINNGSLIKTGGGVSTLDENVEFTNNGTIVEEAGRFDYFGGGGGGGAAEDFLF